MSAWLFVLNFGLTHFFSALTFAPFMVSLNDSKKLAPNKLSREKNERHAILVFAYLHTITQTCNSLFIFKIIIKIKWKSSFRHKWNGKHATFEFVTDLEARVFYECLSRWSFALCYGKFTLIISFLHDWFAFILCFRTFLFYLQ